MTTQSTGAARDAAILHRPDGNRLAYVTHGRRMPAVVFLGGFRSDMAGTKALALDAWARRHDQAFLRFDYFAHGASDGDFAEATVGRWREDALAAIALLPADARLVLVGSSMGGWIMLSIAQELRARLAGLVGIAIAPDFTQELIWPELSPAEQDEMRRAGRLLRPSQYSDQPDILTMRLIEEGAHHLVLDKPLAVDCPVHLLHGTADADVPWRHALRALQHLQTPQGTLTLIKDGDHRLSTQSDIARLVATIESLCG
ncbi:MAG: alpha/beta fold hydrolase [Reyranellaceae bacterium]